MNNTLFEKMKKMLAITVIASVLVMQSTSLSFAQETTTTEGETTTTTENSNPEQVDTSTDTSGSSTQSAEQSTQTQETQTQEASQAPQSTPPPPASVDDDQAFRDWRAEQQAQGNTDNVAQAYRQWLKYQIDYQVQQEVAAKQNPASGPNNSSGSQNASDANGNSTIDTGNATNTAGILTTGNNNLSANAGSGAGAGGASVVNSGNGTASDNNGSATILNNGSTIQDNTAAINNSLSQTTTTGNNNTNDNVGESSITTGDANTTGTIVTLVNTNVDGMMVSEFNVADDHTGDLVLDFAANCVAGCNGGSLLAENSGNGSYSDNDANLDVTNNNNTFQNNDLTLGNDLYLTANSGDNSASDNTGGDSAITTGDANIAANVLTFANNNIAGNVVYGVVNIFGNLIGDIIFPESQLQNCANCGQNIAVNNSGNGSDSTNDANVDLANNDTLFQANDADITNNLVFDATTGDNQTSDNTGGNNAIKTGQANVDANVLNVVNNNLMGGNMWLVIINEGGKWIGKLLGAPSGTNNMAGSEGMQFGVDENGYITASNNGNGTGSDNSANVSQTNNNTTEQQNTANINNNLILDANTGGNRANDNTGGTSNVTTGDANIVANLVNFVNNNISGGGKLYVTVVNVFGSWVGDFVSPGQEKQNNGSTGNQANAGNNGGQNTGGSNTSNNESNEGTSTVSNNQSSRTRTSSDNDSDNDTNANIATNGTGETSVTSGGNAVLGASANAGTRVLSESTVAGSEIQKKIKVNLAWIVVLLPLAAVGILGKKLFFKKVLPQS